MSSRSLSWLTAGGAVILLASPMKLLWAHPSAGWIAPFLIWLALIIVGGWLARPRSGDDL